MSSHPQPARSWRALTAELRRRGLPRRRDDTCATMEARLRADDARRDALLAEVRLVPAILGDVATLQRLAPLLPHYRGRQVDAQTALVPSVNLRRFTRWAKRLGVAVAGEESELVNPVNMEERTSAELAAVRFVEKLAGALGWPEGLVPAGLAAVPPPVDPAVERQAMALVTAWTAALDAALDPLAECALERSTHAARVPADIPARLRMAITEGRPVRLRYQGAPPAAVTERTVEPRTLEGDYLRAFCRWRGQERSFRLDRILALWLLDDTPGETIGGLPG